jgi:uncharacterized coiled-coil protein SlyX
MSFADRQRMRQEDRLGRVASQVEQQRIAMDKIQSQLRVLADEVSCAPGSPS